MRYESMIAEGVPVTLRRHLRHLGLPANLTTLSELTRRLHELTHKPKPTDADAAKTGMMPGHVTFVTTDPRAFDVFSDKIASFSSWRDLPSISPIPSSISRSPPAARSARSPLDLPAGAT